MSSDEQKIVIGGIINGHDLSELSESMTYGKKKFDNYIIAYLDFLGFTEKMKENNSYDSLQILKYLLKGTRKVANHISNINKIEEFDIKIFSDNIVIAQKVEQRKLRNQIISIVNLVGSVQFHALMYFGFFIRGGITIGELSIDSTVVWGTGLIDAYNIENNLANYPRIILSQRLLEEYDSCKQKSLNLYALLKEDFDGLWFIDFLLASPNLENIPNIAKELQEIIKSHAIKSDKVKQKINWLIAHFNASCRKLKDRGDYEKYILSYI